jgi:hypothetical protein
METSSPAYINRLPPEILRMIFLFVYDNKSRFWPKLRRPGAPGSWVASILVLRWVSHRFRIIIDDLDIWQRDEFDITFQFYCLGHTEFENSQFVSMLLRDPRFASTLSRRSCWSFDSLEIFFVLLMNIPEMRQNTRKIVLELEHGLGFAINRLSLFSCLTDLSIFISGSASSSDQLIDLEAIVLLCPLLRNLRLNDLLKYCGSLQTAAKLRQLCLDFGEADDETELELSHELIPIDSSSTLETFHLTFYDAIAMPGLHLLETFSNVTHIVVSWLTPEVLDILINGNFVLTYLNANLLVDESLPSEFVARIFSASSLEQLRGLRFTIHHHGKQSDEIEPIIRGITNLRYLETLRLESPIRISWCDRFAQLRNLKSLEYCIIWVVFNCT